MAHDGSEFTGQFPGGNFTAIQGDDGLWTIKAVPVLAQMKAGERRNQREINSAWMRRCIDRHRQLEREEKHLAAVHENHHDPGAITRRIGFMRPTHVGTVMARGKPVDALFADFVGIEDADYQELKKLRLPYRSVEVHPSWKPEIQSLALMEDEAPHHKLPMLTIGEEHQNRNLVSLRQGDDSLFIVQLLEEASMAKNKDRTATKAPPKDKLQDEPEDDKDDDGEENLGGDLGGMIKELQDSIPALIEQAIASKIEEIKAAVGDSGDEEEDGDQAPAEQFAENDMDKLTSLEKQNAEMAGRLAALEKKDSERTENEKVAGLVEAECQKLRSEGWAVDAGLRASMVKLADDANDPATSLATFVESYRRNTPQEPAEDIEMLGARGLITGTETIDDLPEAVAKYRDKGPEALARATELWRDHESLKASLRGFDEPLEDHIEINWDAA